MNKKHTKRALLMSCISMLLCISMLVGTTFAWFTDTVTSGVNQIVAGNLDIEAEYNVLKADGTLSDTWENLANSTSLFKSDLWEPGHTEYAVIRVKNAGTLALKYQAKVDVVSETGSVNVAGTNFKLSDYLNYGVRVDANAPVLNRDAAAAMATTKLGAYASKEKTLAPGSGYDYITLAITMPTTVDNKANYDKAYNAPSINLGITVFATQVESENDSFGNDYDANALYGDATFTTSSNVVFPISATASKDDTTGDYVASLTTKTSTNNEVYMGKVTVPAGKVEDGKTPVVNVKPATSTDGNFTVNPGEKAVFYDIHVENLKSDENEVTVELQIGAGLTNVVILHDHDNNPSTDAVDVNATYDPATGIAKFTTKTFSPFAIKYEEKRVVRIGDTYYSSLADAISAAKNTDTITFSGTVDYTMPTTANNTVDWKGVTIEGEKGATIVFRNAENDATGGANNAISNVTMKNLSIVDETYYGNQNGENAWEFTYLEFGGTTAFENVKFTDGAMFQGTSVTATNCSFVGHNNDSSALGNKTMYGAWVQKGDATFTGCTFTGTRGLKVADVYGTDGAASNVTVDSCTFGPLSEKPGVAINDANGKNDKITIKNSTFQGTQAGEQGNYIYETDDVVPKLENNKVIIYVFNADGLKTALTAGGNIVLMNDIDMAGYEWPHIRANNAIVLDGNGKTISGLNATQTVDDGFKNFALIASAWNTVEIKNLTVDGATVTGNGMENSHGAVLVGANWGKATITNVTVKNSTISNCDRSSVLIAYNYDAPAEITGCTVENCNINSIGTAGALLGYNNGQASTISGCTVKNTTISSSEGSNKAGILLGTNGGSKVTLTNNTHENCKAINAGVETNNETGRLA